MRGGPRPVFSSRPSNRPSSRVSQFVSGKSNIEIRSRNAVPHRRKPMTTQIMPLAEAVARFVKDGQTLAMEGFTHLIPFAAGHEVIRQRRKDLTLVRMTPDIIYDQLIGMGCAAGLVFSWGGNPGVGSIHRFRDAIENGWPRPLAIQEHSHADMAGRYQAGASGLPFSVLRGYVGSDLPKHNPNIKSIACPVTGGKLPATPRIH